MRPPLLPLRPAPAAAPSPRDSTTGTGSALDAIWRSLHGMTDTVLDRLPHFGVGLLVVLLFWLAGRLVLRFAHTAGQRTRLDPQLADVFESLAVATLTLLGVLTMLGEPIPIIGPIIVAIPIVLVALLQSPTKAVLALGLFTLLQQVEGDLLTPNIMRRQTDVPQTLVIFAIVAGAAIGGLLGVLASIPVAAALRVLTLEVLVPAVRRWTGAAPA